MKAHGHQSWRCPSWLLLPVFYTPHSQGWRGALVATRASLLRGESVAELLAPRSREPENRGLMLNPTSQSSGLTLPECTEGSQGQDWPHYRHLMAVSWEPPGPGGLAFLVQPPWDHKGLRNVGQFRNHRLQPLSKSKSHL